ncbi:Phthiocerol synthesis polyketide synthase type I PpsC [Streptomyces sp. YIM 130001]|uniref:zinc-binding dehydrogenase n=1 Tax=Streptomyces sp. YIM 130001 TaxID=2259644 RepID=UPI000E6575BE|nr:zinc-binding dehydrogenase [Streptomyces sp. YIM 130001]RII09214.1 Phthiocerol synthesis polyketide synthase type I PpsC [Streptomyces sp. YIM 130001]
MRAIQVAAFGAPEVLAPVDLPDPVPGPGQVVVGMVAADVIFLDTLLRSGWGQDIFPRTLPYVPGGGGAGEVLAVGDGVDPDRIGRHVAVRTGTGYAEQVVASEEEVMPIPDGLAPTTAAALVHDGVTALDLHRLGAPRSGEWVLVSAAAGGAGSLLVQLAVDAGARVVAAASSDAKRALASDLGAEVVVDYTRADWIEQVREATGGGAALAYDGAGGALGSSTLDALADGGRFVTYGTADGFAAPDRESAERRNIRLLEPLADGPPDQGHVRELLDQALKYAADGRLRPAIGATYPLDRAADAHRALAARTTVGKSLLLAGGE